jgi:hypothetical protein
MQRRGCRGLRVGDKGAIAGVAGVAAAGAAIVLTAVLIMGLTRPAAALPAFARQTGQPCGKCHTDFPSLTPFGRRFKLGGYTLGGGEFRTTPWPSADDSKTATDKMRSNANSLDSAKDEGADKGWVPPIAMMTIVGFTHTQTPLSPPTDRSNPMTMWCFHRSAPSGAAPSPTTSALLRRSPTTRLLPGDSQIRSDTPGPGTIPIFAMPGTPPSATWMSLSA